jgi:hypothetical protein
MKITETDISILKNRILENERLESKADGSYEFFERIVKVFERIPDADAEALLRKNFYLVIPFSNTVYRRNIISGECWLVFLQTDLWDKRKTDDEVQYTIAHELAHLFFEHDAQSELSAKEEEADRKVIEWGFEKELRATSHNYLYGTGHLLKTFDDVTLVKH